jgi:hypothetical protein
MASHAERPVARIHDLVLKTAGDEVLVYDLPRHRAHSLNSVAAAVWRRCDGTRSAAAIAAGVRGSEGLPVTADAVRYALAALGRAELLEAPPAAAGLTRRELVRRLGTAAAVALPVVTSIVAPSAAHAQSCSLEGDPCTQPSDCCPGGCDFNLDCSCVSNVCTTPL